MSERWNPEKGDSYWVVSTLGKVEFVDWRSEDWDKDATEFGNCFETKEEAEAAAEKLKELLLSLHDNGTSTDSETLKGTFTEYLKKCAEIKADIILQKARERRLPEQYYNGPEKKTLPDWCKVGEWVWSIAFNTYFKVDKVDGLFIQGTDFYGSDYCVAIDYARQARLRPYNAEEMKALMGKVIKKGSSMHIVTGFEDVFDMVHVNGCLYAANDLLRQFTIDNAPCGILEHLKNGEWVN